MPLYIPKSTKIYVVELTTLNSWIQILTPAQAKAIRGIRIKSRFTSGQPAPVAYDIAFVSSPASGTTSTGNGFLSFSGAENDITIEPRKGVWARSQKAGAIIEIMVLE